MAKTEIFKNYIDFLNRTDKSTNGVSREFADLHPNFKRENAHNIGCWECIGSYCCEYCTNLISCAYLTGAHNLRNIKQISKK